MRTGNTLPIPYESVSHRFIHQAFCPFTFTTKEEEIPIFPFKKTIFTKHIIALGSIEHGIGVTHLSLALSNFLCSKQGMKVAYVELNATNQICSLHPGTENTHFSHMRIMVFPRTTLTSLPEILSMDFDYFILDMGILNTYTAREFFKCEKMFLVCSLSKWKRRHTVEKIAHLLSNTNHTQEYVTLLVSNGENESTISISDRLTFKVYSIPFIPNPFQLHSDFFSFFGKILR